MELTFDRRLRLDASDKKLLRVIAAAEAGDIVTIEFVRACVERVQSEPVTHVFAGIMRTMIEQFLEEAEALVRSARLH